MLAGAIVAALDAPSASVRFDVLLTWFQTDTLSLLADGICVAIACGYLLGVRRLAGRGRRWRPGATASFLTGLLVIFVAVGSGLAAYDDVNFPMHVLQHLLLMMIAPPLIAIGRPVTLAAQAVRRPIQVRIVRVAASRFAHVVFGPLAFVAYYALMAAAFCSPLYRYDEEHSLAHDATHLLLILVGYLFWQGIVGLEPVRGHRAPVRRFVLLLLGMPIEAVIGFDLMLRSTPLTFSTLGLTHEGGQAFLVGAMTITGVALAALAYDWARRDELRTRNNLNTLTRQAPTTVPAAEPTIKPSTSTR